MKKLAQFSVDNPVCVNLIMITILIMGFALYTLRMPKEIFPDFSENSVLVTTIYPGASTYEIEKNLTVKIEDAVKDLDNVERIFSTSQEGISTVMVEASADLDNMAKFVSDAQQAVDQIEDFPNDAEDPLVREVESEIPIITVSLFGNLNLLRIRDYAEDLKDIISSLPGVSDVRVSGLPERQVRIEVNPEALKRYNLTPARIADAVRSRNFDLPAGNMPTSQGEFLVRTVGSVPNSSDLLNIPIKTAPNGGMVRLGDVAEVLDWFERPSTIGRFNLQRSVNLNITKTKRSDAIAVADAIQDAVAEFRDRLPPTLGASVFNDTSVYIENRLDTLKTSGVQGLIVVFLLLFMMLNVRTSILVTIGIPVSFLGALIIMSYTGMTMNMIAMFAMIVVLGLVVDDAVVIGENIYRHYEKGMSPREAAILGASEVAWPVVSAVSTTIAAFLPLLLIPGTMGIFLGVIPKVVIFALLVSLVEALIILPSHMADFLPEDPPPPSRFRERLNDIFEDVISRYSRLLNKALEWRYVFIVGALGVTAVIVGYSVLYVPFQLFHRFEGSQFFINVEAPPSSSLYDTEAFVRAIERAARNAVPDNEFKSIVTNVGFVMNDFNSVDNGENLAQIIVELVDLGAGRDRPINTVIDDVRRAVQPLQSQGDINIKELQSGPGGKPIYILLRGDDLTELESIAEDIKAFVREFPGASDVKDNMEAGKPELRVRLKPQAYSLGLTDADVAMQLRAAFWGTSGAKFQGKNEDVDILIRYPDHQKENIDDLTRFPVTLPSGETVPLLHIADVRKVKGVDRIIRDDRKRAVTITGELDQTKTTAVDLASAVSRRYGDIGQKHPGVSMTTERGEIKDINDSMKALAGAFLLGVLLIYFILGTQFKSYFQPLVVMSAIPFGIDGVLLGHIIMGKTLGLLSMIGLVALSGIVVNDSLVLVDFVNKRRREGSDRRSSLLEAGMIRFRPVLLTSLTTMGGIFFLAFLASGQAKFLAPMAISLFFGLMLSTVITLFIVPSLYAVLDDLVKKLGRKRGTVD